MLKECNLIVLLVLLMPSTIPYCTIFQFSAHYVPFIAFLAQTTTPITMTQFIRSTLKVCIIMNQVFYLIFENIKVSIFVRKKVLLLCKELQCKRVINSLRLLINWGNEQDAKLSPLFIINEVLSNHPNILTKISKLDEA